MNKNYFKKDDLNKNKYIISIIKNIQLKKPILVKDGCINNKYVFDYNDDIKLIENCCNDINEYKKIIYPNNKYAEIFVSGNKRFKFTQICKSPYSKMGGNINSQGKKLADAGEKATINAIELYVQNMVIKKPEDTNEQLFIDNPNAFYKWQNTFDKTPKIIDSIVQSNLSDYIFAHDGSSDNEFADIVNKIVKEIGGSKDSWNPADLWIIKKDKFLYIKEEINKILENNNEQN